jgi:hypothetical protein
MTATRNRESASSLRIRRRKSSLYTAFVPIHKTHPTHQNSSRRFVYVVARPIKKARNAASLSEGKFSLCHWALLISPYNPHELQQCIQNRVENCTRERAAWGKLFEIFDDRGAIRLRVVEHFGLRQTLMPDWGYACIMHLGRTRLQDEDITQHGSN